MGISGSFLSLKRNFVLSSDRPSLLRKLGSRYGIENITYLNTCKYASIGLLTTYSSKWQNHYFNRGFDLVDPVLAYSAKSHLPLDWATIPRSHKRIIDFFGEASDFGVADQGISIPVFGTDGARALVSIGSNAHRNEWKAIIKFKVPELIYFAHLLHAIIPKSKLESKTEETRMLSIREREVLRWAAEGKTSWETSQILRLSEATVNFYIRNACKKLDATNKTQAVVKAMRMNALEQVRTSPVSGQIISTV